MRYALALLVLLAACEEPAAPTWPPPGPTLHIMNATDSPLDISYRPVGRPDVFSQNLGQIPSHAGRCIRVAPIGATVLRAYSPAGEVRDSADLSISADWRWDIDASRATTLEPISTICVHP